MSLPWSYRITSLCLIVAFCTENARAEEIPVPVVAVRTRQIEGASRQWEITGSITPARNSRLSAQIAGHVKSLQIDAGSEVKKGDVLAELDADLAEIALEETRARITEAEVQLQDAQNQVAEVEGLTRSGAFAKTELERLKTAVQIAESKLAQWKAQEKRDLEMIERHQIKAPFDGVIRRKLTETGEWLQTGTAVAELVETGQLWFDLQLPQEAGKDLEQIESVTVSLDAYPGESFPAKLSMAVPVLDPATRTFLARLVLEDTPRRISPGMSGRAVIALRSASRSSITVPRDAIVLSPDGTATIWIVKGFGEQTKVESREVKISGAMGDDVEILEGLQADEHVVLRGNESLTENRPVKLLEDSSENR